MVAGRDVRVGQLQQQFISDHASTLAAQEQQFAKQTGIWASAPARVGLDLLMHQDVSAKSLAKIWQKGLYFHDDQFDLKIFPGTPVIYWLVMAGLTCITIAMGTCMAFNAAVAIIAPLIFGWLFVFGVAILLTNGEYARYTISKRIEPLVDSVNRQLPAALAAWRQRQAQP
ncbi:hypothetical protein [Andreprevotia lacus]|uniref:hypothetical protein n=1 Tax=Andreprevotia lacus TaxID=1121000 RepID=UPI00111C12E7|nr:hypothetical protein [Andreprevotia lacus]